ncbi:MAG: TolC family protein [Bacteroidales bacterium]|nr:TolC family protein [Bacteroidales bacterium]
MKRNYIILALLLPLAGWSATAQTLSLADCRRIASGENATIKNAELDVLSARSQRQEAMSLWFPSLSVAGLGARAWDPLVQVDLQDLTGTSDYAVHFNYYARLAGDMYGFETSWKALDYGYMASALLVQPVFAGGRIVNGNRLAQLGVEAAETKRSLAQRESLDEVDRKYWQVVSLQDKMGTVDQALSMLDKLGEDVVNAFEAGLALDTDTLKVAKERNRLLLDKMRLESGLRLSKTDLMNYIGYVPENLDSLTLSDDLEDVSTPESYYRDPAGTAAGTQESRLLSMQVEAASLQKKMTIGEALPQVAVGATYGYGRLVGGPQWNGVAFATVSIPITDWWKTGAKAKRCEYEIRKASNERDYLNKQLELKVNALWEKLLTNWGALKVAQDNVALEELNESRLHDLYDVGGATLSELLMAQVDLRTSRSALVDARIDYRLAVAEYIALVNE